MSVMGFGNLPVQVARPAAKVEALMPVKTNTSRPIRRRDWR
jgi:hypothetical protein